MPLDRSFVMKGFGTVVTGTLLSGAIHDGQTLQLEPGSRAVRVRGLQTHGQAQRSAQPGSRVAVNLSGVDATQVHRGQTLVAPKTLSPVDTIDAEVRLLQSAPAMKHRASVHFHAFTSETMASISLYGYEASSTGNGSPRADQACRTDRARSRRPICPSPAIARRNHRRRPGPRLSIPSRASERPQRSPGSSSCGHPLRRSRLRCA